MASNSQWFKLFTTIICAICSLYQVYDLTYSYLRGDVLTEIHMQEANTFRFPAITISVPMTAMVNFTALFQKHLSLARYLYDTYKLSNANYTQQIRRIATMTAEEDIVKNLTVQQLFDISYDFDDVFQNMIVPKSDESSLMYVNRNLSKACNVTKYFKSNRILFTLHCHPSDKHFSVEQLFQYSESGLIFMIAVSEMLWKRSNYMNIHLHSPGTLLRSVGDVRVSVSDTASPTVRISTYRRIETTLLPAPYETDCVDYTELGFESRQAKIEACENEMMYEKYNRTFIENIRNKDSNDLIFQNSIEENYSPEEQAIRKECRQRSKQLDCFREWYIPTLQPPVHNSRRINAIGIKITREPEMVKVCKQKTSFAEYLTLVCSVFGFWFGVSVTSMLIVAGTHVAEKKLLKKVKIQPSIRLSNSMKPTGEINKGLEKEETGEMNNET